MTPVVAVHALPANPFAVEDVYVRNAKACVWVHTGGSCKSRGFRQISIAPDVNHAGTRKSNGHVLTEPLSRWESRLEKLGRAAKTVKAVLSR